MKELPQRDGRILVSQQPLCQQSPQHLAEIPYKGEAQGGVLSHQISMPSFSVNSTPIRFEWILFPLYSVKFGGSFWQPLGPATAGDQGQSNGSTASLPGLRDWSRDGYSIHFVLMRTAPGHLLELLRKGDMFVCPLVLHLVV